MGGWKCKEPVIQDPDKVAALAKVREVDEDERVA